ncbi:MAG TPA: hypothetical protein VJQ25_10995 [Nitrospira sp.]|nr:hypothetical protein [Nitrospira sp.]
MTPRQIDKFVGKIVNLTDIFNDSAICQIVGRERSYVYVIKNGREGLLHREDIARMELVE